MPQATRDSAATIAHPTANIETPVSAVRDMSPVAVTDSAAMSSDVTVADSVAVDSVKEDSRPLTVNIVAPPPRPAWMDGLEPAPLTDSNRYDQGFVSVIVVLMLSICLSFKSIRRTWNLLLKRMWITRSRQDFDHITSVERRTIGLMLVLSVFFIGTITCAAMAKSLPGSCVFNFASTLRMCAIVGSYFLFQYAAYETVGFTFTSEEGRQMWVEGFTSVMSILGVLLVIPGLAVIFYPEVTVGAVGVAAALYIIARIIFISKGFRIFYTNFSSLVYFILYLCTLELVPITMFYHFARLYC